MKRRTFLHHTILTAAGMTAARCGINTDEPLKIVILGFDGAGWKTIDPLIEAGKLPYLKKLRENSAWADFKTFNPAKSHIVWTSIATGKTMLKHGILDFTYMKKNNIRVPYTRNELRAPQIWSILQEFGKRSVVINWYATHPPPEKMDGILVSNRFRRAAIKRPEKAGKLVDSVYPPSIFPTLHALIDRDYSRILQRINVSDFPKLFRESHPDKKPGKIPVLGNFATFIKQEAAVEMVSRHLFTKSKWDFFATYFRLPDLVQHFGWFFLPEELRREMSAAWEAGIMSPELLSRGYGEMAKVLEPVYRYMETIIESYISQNSDANTLFFIVSDHGFAFHPRGYSHLNLPEDHAAPDGIILMHGGDVRPGKLIKASVFDVAPSILHALNLPVGKNMDGRILKEAFKHQRKIRYRPYTLESAGSKKRNREYDSESLEELKAIGYIQ